MRDESCASFFEGAVYCVWFAQSCVYRGVAFEYVAFYYPSVPKSFVAVHVKNVKAIVSGVLQLKAHAFFTSVGFGVPTAGFRLASYCGQSFRSFQNTLIPLTALFSIHTFVMWMR